MMRFAIVVAAAATLAACASRDKAATSDTAAAESSAPVEIQMAIAVKRGIDEAPTKADSVLTANGLTSAGFDSLMYRIAGDSALRAAYAAASR